MTEELQNEAMHATFLAQDVFDRHVSSHPRIQANPSLRRKAAAISGLMDQLYRALDGDRAAPASVPLTPRLSRAAG
jgi:hypothetical protein